MQLAPTAVTMAQFIREDPKSKKCSRMKKDAERQPREEGIASFMQRSLRSGGS